MSEAAVLPRLLVLDTVHSPFFLKPLAIKNRIFKKAFKSSSEKKKTIKMVLPADSSRAGAFLCEMICGLRPQVHFLGNSRCVSIQKLLFLAMAVVVQLLELSRKLKN